MKTLYDLLGVGHDATEVDIEEGYLRTLNDYAADLPHRLQEEEKRYLQAINDACQLLSDPTQRQMYDLQLIASVKARKHAAQSNHSERGKGIVILALIIACVGQFYSARHEKQQLHSPQSKVGAHSTEDIGRDSGISPR